MWLLPKVVAMTSSIAMLSQRGIGHIRESAEIILRNRGIDVDVHAVQKFKNDLKVKNETCDLYIPVGIAAMRFGTVIVPILIGVNR